MALGGPASFAIRDSDTISPPAQRPKRGPRPPDQKDKPPIRTTRKPLTVYLPPEVPRTLKFMAFDEDTTTQALVGEAIDLLMKDRGRPPFGAR